MGVALVVPRIDTGSTTMILFLVTPVSTKNCLIVLINKNDHYLGKYKIGVNLSQVLSYCLLSTFHSAFPGYSCPHFH